MKSPKYNTKRIKTPPTPEELDFKTHTNDTTAELSLFYNIALDRINDLITFYEKKTVYIEKLNLDTPVLFENETYLHLKVYLWKEEISKSFTQIKQFDRNIIHAVLKKLVDLRNFHSHYYHDAEALKFPKELRDFITVLFDKAKNQLVAKNKNFEPYILQLEEGKTTFRDRNDIERVDIYPHFDFFEESTGSIKEEGKNFFLSLFLLKGEMSKFLKKRKRCKQDNGEKYQVKTKLYTFFCHRDGSNRFFLAGKKDYYDEKEQLRRQFNTILNYLKTKPVADREYIPPTKEVELHSKSEMAEIKESRKQQNENDQPREAKEVIRRSRKFMEMSIRYLMDRKKLGHADEYIMQWAVRTLGFEETEKQAAAVIQNPDSKTYFEAPVEWCTEFIAGNFAVIKNNHARFKISDDIEFVISEREMKNWLFYLLMPPRKTFDETVKKLIEYGTQFNTAMDELKRTNTISFQNYPLVFGADGNDRGILSEMHLKIIEQQHFNQGVYLKKIIDRINTTIDFLEKELKQKDKYVRNRKNRAILKCFNWFLPEDAKLKPDEVNQLSIYNFVSENDNLQPASRANIISRIHSKLTKAKEDAFQLIQSAKSLDALYEAMLRKKITALQAERIKVDNYSLQELHKLAAKLSVSLPGMDVSRSGKNRLDELKETIERKPVLIPNGFFKSVFAPQEGLTISTLVKKRRDWQSLLIEKNYELSAQDEFINGKGEGEFKKDISRETLSLVEENFESLFAAYAKKQGQDFRQFVDLFMDCSTEKSEARRKEIVKAINLYKSLKETKVCDAILAQILFQYHNLELRLDEREQKHVNIATLFENEYSLVINNDLTLKVKYKQLDDLATNWDRRKIGNLVKNLHYWNEDLLKDLDKDKKSDQQKILILMHRLFEDSFYYIRTFLDVEKKVLTDIWKNSLKQLLEESRKPEKQGMMRVEPDVLIKRLNQITQAQVDKFIELRRSAFHTDVPPKNLKYTTEKDELMALAGIPKPQPRDKNKYIRK